MGRRLVSVTAEVRFPSLSDPQRRPGGAPSRDHILGSASGAANALAHDAQEGMTAFLEKRDPVWRRE